MSAADIDVAIVGAGFAGLAAAKAAAGAGLKTVVYDAKPAVGARLHTTGIFVKEAYEVLPIPAEHARRIDGVRLYGPSRRTVDLHSPGAYFLTTDTSAVLNWMADEARSVGAHIRTGARFRGGETTDDGVTLSIGGENVCARWLLGADGARSTVAEAFGLGLNRRFLTGLEREYALARDLDPAFLHCFLDSRSAPGYLAWAAAAPRFTQVGLAVSHGRRPSLQPFAQEAERLFGLDPDSVVERRAGRIPCGGLVKPWAGGRVTLVGDAAGMVSPMTGGGIKLALDLGAKAGAAVAAHLTTDGPRPERALAAHMPRFGVKSFLRAALDVAPANPLLELALSTAAFRAFARRVYFSKGGGNKCASLSSPVYGGGGRKAAGGGSGGDSQFPPPRSSTGPPP